MPNHSTRIIADSFRPMIMSVATCAAFGMCGASTLAQSISGSTSVSARCGPGTTRNYSTMESFEVSAHGDCPASRAGGLASSNDARSRSQMGQGEFEFDARAHTNFFGTRDDAGSSSAAVNFIFQASDVVFSDVANPNRTGVVDVSLNYVLAGLSEFLGASNCSPFNPNTSISFELVVGGCRGQGAMSYQGPGGGSSSTGVFATIPQTGARTPLTTNSAGIDLFFPRTCSIFVTLNNNVLYCDSPPADEGLARSFISFSLPCNGPVFNLPPGITVNSAQLGIVNNRWRGATCCIADVDDGSGTGVPDGGVTIDDLLYYLGQFEQGLVAADVDDGTGTGTPDGGVTIDDLLYYLVRFEAGC